MARLQLEFIESQREAVEDSEHNQYSPIGQIKLRWHKKDLARSHAETFYVVEMTACEVILGANVFSESTDAVDSGIRILGLDQQTSGMTQSPLLDDSNIVIRWSIDRWRVSLSKEEKERQEHEKQKARERRAKEKKEQEEREAKKRAQDGRTWQGDSLWKSRKDRIYRPPPSSSLNIPLPNLSLEWCILFIRSFHTSWSP